MLKGMCLFVDSHSGIRTRVLRNGPTLGSRNIEEKHGLKKTEAHHRYEVNQLAFVFFLIFLKLPGRAQSSGHRDATVRKAKDGMLSC